MRKPCFRNRLDITVFFNEDAVRAIHHDFADIGIENEVLDRAEKRKNQFEAIHHNSPWASCRKYDLLMLL